MQGRAPRAQPTAPQARGTRARPPSPAIISARGRSPEGGKPDGGKGGAPLDGRGGGRGASPRETERPALPHATASAAAIGQASARRQAAGAPEGRKGHAPARHADARESAASGQAAQTADAETASGRGSRPTSTPRPAAARPRTRTAERRRDGRRRRRPGGTGARLLAAPSPAVSAEKTPRKDAQAASAADVEASAPRRAQIPPLRGSQSFRARPQRCTARAAARRPPTAGRRLGWPDSVSLPSLPFFRGCCGLLCLFSAKNAQKGEKTQNRACLCVCHCDILRVWVYVAHGKERMTWKKREIGLSRRETRA